MLEQNLHEVVLNGDIANIILTHLKLDFHRQLFCHIQDKSRWASSHSFADKGQHQNTVDVYKSQHGMGLSASFSLTIEQERECGKPFQKGEQSLKGKSRP